MTGARGLEQVAYEHIWGDVGKMHLKPSHRGLLDERLRLRIKGEASEKQHLVAVHLGGRDCLLHLVGSHRTVLGTKADGSAERTAILLRFCLPIPRGRASFQGPHPKNRVRGSIARTATVDQVKMWFKGWPGKGEYSEGPAPLRRRPLSWRKGRPTAPGAAPPGPGR